MQFEVQLYQYLSFTIIIATIAIIRYLLKIEKKSKKLLESLKMETILAENQFISIKSKNEVKIGIVENQLKSTRIKLKATNETSPEYELIQRIELLIQLYGSVWKK